MGVEIFKSAGWDTHRQVKLREIDWPLLAEDPAHFTILRTYEGPESTFKRKPLDALDDEFNGAVFAATATAADDVFVLASASPLFTGCAVVVSNIAGGLTGVSAQTYYAIRVASDQIKLAATLADAEAGTAVNVTADGTCDITIPTAYLVEHGKVSDSGGDDVSYARLFATIPAQWSEPGAYTYTYPALASAAIGTPVDVTAIAASGSDYVLTTSADAVLVSGDSCFVSVKYTRGGLVYQWSGYTRATAASTATTATIPGVFVGTGAFSSVSGSVVKGSPSRAEPEDISGESRIIHDYALSSPAALATDLPISQPFTPVVTATGQKTTSLSTTTTPTAAVYAANVTNGVELIAEPPTRDRYLGNIYVRRTHMVPAR